jgi:hypothetical protein
MSNVCLKLIDFLSWDKIIAAQLRDDSSLVLFLYGESPICAVAIFYNDDDFTTLRRHCENKGMSQHRRKIVIFHI